MTIYTFMITLCLVLIMAGGIMILDMIGVDVLNTIEKEMAKFGSYLEKRGF